MKFFISWSGDLSRKVAELLSTRLPNVLQGTKPWLSENDIDKGSIWFRDITKELSETGVGIVCLTRENKDSAWILFEAGALSKGLTKSRVCPLLIDLVHSDLRPPLSQFNGTLPTKGDLLKLVKTINGQRGD
jgi:TIR domain